MEKKVKKLLLVSILFMAVFLILIVNVRAYDCQDFCGLGWGGAWCKSGCAAPGVYCKCQKVLWWCVDSAIEDCSEKNCCIPVGFSKCGSGQYYNKIITGYTKLCNANTGSCTRERIDSVFNCGHYYSYCGYNQMGDPKCFCTSNRGNCDNNWNNGCEINLLTNVNHCGWCHHKCSTGEICENGQCVSAGPEIIECNSCEDCSHKLNSALSGSIIKLNKSIDGSKPGSGICIEWTSGNDVNFNCQGYEILGESNDVGIYVANGGNSTVKNCEVRNFDDGFSIWTQNTKLINNIACDNTIDIYNGTGTAGSSGTNNTCDNSHNWNDQGTTGCSNLCEAVLECNSCEDCTQKLNAVPEGSIVKLTTDITNSNKKYCINITNELINNVTFDCQGYTIDGIDSFTSRGIHVTKKYVTIKNCMLSDWGHSIQLWGSKHSLLKNNFVNSSYGCGILLWYAKNNTIISNNITSTQYFGDAIHLSVESNENKIINNNIFNRNSHGIRMHNSHNNILNSNYVCDSVHEDIIVEYGSSGNTGVDNTCDKTIDWNDNETTGCTYDCEVTPTECKITNANVKPYCDAEGCKNGDKIELNISVENISKCINVNQIEIDASSSAAGQPTGMVIGNGGFVCSVQMKNSTPIEQTDANTYLGNWTVIVPYGCQGKTVEGKTAKLFNASSGIVPIAQKRGRFGTFTFAEALVGEYNLSVYTCGDDPPDGQCDDYNVNGSITVNNNNWGNAPQSRLLPSGDYLVSFGSVSGWPYKPNNLGVSLPPDILLWGFYTKVAINYALLIVQAKNKTGHFIDAPIRLYLDGLVNLSTNEVKYNYTGDYPVEFEVKFDEVAEYEKPEDIEITIYGNGIYLFTFFYEREEVGCFCEPIHVACGLCYDPTSECIDDNGIGKIVPCQSGWICNYQTGKCEPSANPNQCYQNQTLCHDVLPPGSCYWDLQPTDLCKHCIEDDPGSCSGYDNVIACEADPCGEKYTGCPSGSTCECMWDDSLKECYLNVQQQGAGNICCEYSVSFGECGVCEGQTNSRRRTTICTGPCQSGDQCSMTTYEHCALTGYEASMEDCQSCAVLFRPMPFFSWFNILAVVSLLIVFYLFMFRKKKL